MRTTVTRKDRGFSRLRGHAGRGMTTEEIMALTRELDRIALDCARLPVLDPRTPDEILGYDEAGLPR